MKEKIEKLRHELNHHNYLYYVLDKPKISDFKFDSLMRELIKLEKRYPEFFDPLSPTMRVGGGLNESFETVQHISPMLSLSNTYSKKELVDFDSKIKKILGQKFVDYTCELKYDGVAISLIYKNGLLERGVTRGDGVCGDDVTQNIKTINTIPLKLFGDFPSFIEFRGEVFIKKDDFNKINQKREERRMTLEKEYYKKRGLQSSSNDIKLEKQYLTNLKKNENYANPRNFASGSLKLLDSAKVAKRNLDCIIYSVHGVNLPFNSHYKNLLKVQDWGFKISKSTQLYNNVNSMMDFIDSLELQRESLPFEIDGVVVKVNNLIDQETLGHTAKSPRWAISYKFQSAQAYTVLSGITYQIGRTGTITPVAELNPVHLAGSVIKRASLHNADFIKKLDLKIGDTVLVEKGGDVIPKVAEVDIAKRTLLCQDIIFISECPSCNSALYKPSNEVNFYCLNSDYCVPQKIARVKHFIGRDALNIHTLGSKTVVLLFQENIINSIADLYDLSVNKLTCLKGFGEKSKSIKKAQNIIESLENSKAISFERVLYGLGIRYVGKTVAKKIVNHFLSIESLISSSREQLLEIDEVGEKIADSICHYFKQSKNISLIEKLKLHGLQFNTHSRQRKSNKLQNLIFVISGTFVVSRLEIKDSIEDNGGKCNTSLSKNTNYLIAGENMGPKKKELALLLGVPIISQIELEKMLK